MNLNDLAVQAFRPILRGLLVRGRAFRCHVFKLPLFAVRPGVRADGVLPTRFPPRKTSNPALGPLPSVPLEPNMARKTSSPHQPNPVHCARSAKSARPARRPTDILLERLEDRVLFDAVPDATLNLPAEETINENFDFSVDFDNTSPTSGGPQDVGYGPYVDLHVPPGVDINSAEYLGSPVNMILAGEFNLAGDLVQVGSGDPGTPVDHPLLGTPVSGGTPGDLLYVIELPFGSFVPDQPLVTIDIDSLTGSTNNSNLRITYQAIVPKQDANGSEIIDPTNGDDELGLNEASAAGVYDGNGVAVGIDSPPGTDDGDDTDYVLQQKSIAIQKNVAW